MNPAPALNPTRAFGSTSTSPPPYAPPRSLTPTDLALDANEGPQPPTWLVESLAKLDPQRLRRYPDLDALEHALAGRLGVARECVLATAGGDDAIDRACRALLAPGACGLVHAPTFEMIPRAMRLAGAGLRQTPWLEGPFPIGPFAAELARPGVALAAIVSPNNPTGLLVSTDDLLAAAKAARAAGAALLIDLAYIEFAGEDPTPPLIEFDNVVVVRTLSKAWGLAGLRVGCAVASPAMLARLRSVSGPFPISSLSLEIAANRLQGPDDDVRSGIRRVEQERAELAVLLAGHGLAAAPSAANFVLARCGSPTRARWLVDGLAGLGIAVRAFPGRAFLEDACRITCPCDEAAWTRLEKAIRSVLAPEAILQLDDGAPPDAPVAPDSPISAIVRARYADASSAIAQMLSRLNASSGWLVASTPSGAAIARAAGLVPLALAPGASPEASDHLLRAGFARVIPTLQALKELLP